MPVEKNILSLIVLGSLLLPISVFAATSAGFNLDPDANTFSITNTATSSSFQLQGSIDPIGGKSTGAINNFELYSGGTFRFACGDGFKDPSEQCDTAQLNSATCATQGFASGTLTCSSTCRYVTSSCVAVVVPSGGGGGGGGGGAPVPVAGVGAPVKPMVASEITANAFTYKVSFPLYGTKDPITPLVFVNSSSVGMTYPANNTWKTAVSLLYGLNTFKIIAKNDTVSTPEIQFQITRRLIGDASGDNTVNDYDLSRVAKLWGSASRLGDFNEDSAVNDYDFSMMVARWGMGI